MRVKRVITHIHKSTYERVWLPSLNGLLQPHAFCEYCGSVKNISSDRAKGIGHYINVLAEIKRYMERRSWKLSQAQNRLIIKELEGMEDFADIYIMRGSAQKNIFIGAVKKYTGLSRSLIESFL
ncbi:MAG TPA: hypothetical protein ENH28_05740 [Euryarchaeota archaeon]|nr:hypothetical protein BMS3Bbin15_00751 [archaeon BMS3Bbin15]HDL15633.1 hypothetical protein [Euryarchaeota archaeon]